MKGVQRRQGHEGRSPGSTGLQRAAGQHLQPGPTQLYGMDQRTGHLRPGAGTVVSGQDRVQPLKERERQRLGGPVGLLQRPAFAHQQGWACNDQRLKTQLLQVALDLAFDAVVKNARLRIGPMAVTTPQRVAPAARAARAVAITAS